MQLFRTRLANSTSIQVKASECFAKMINIVNLHNAIIYVKIYDKASAPDPSADIPVLTLQIPASGTFTQSAPEIISSVNAMYVRAVTESGDTGTTAPGTLPIIEIGY